MTTLHEIQASFIHDIYTGERTSEDFLDPTLCTSARLDIYYNNTLFGLTDILANAFPVVQKILDEDFFRILVKHYIRAHPQTLGNRHHFGGDIPSFLKSFPQTQKFLYLPDVAALEWAHFEAEIADDAVSLSFKDLLNGLSLNPYLSLKFHPSVHILDQRFNALDIWMEHQKVEVEAIHLIEDPHKILVWRTQDDVVLIRKISDAFGILVTSCQNGESFADAMVKIENNGEQIQDFQQEFSQAVSLGVFISEKG
ncbi:MAG: DNA-binding domain-containing protein [Emcibacter sp.]|nr:DNA-binding domain-containing protein [Emcibacter sp.]